MGKKNIKLLYYFAGYVMLMGIAGFLRTSAMMPLYLNGSFALVTTVLSFLYYTRKSIYYSIILAWVSLNFLMYTYMTLFGVSAHPNPTFGTYFIFGSMAVFSGISIVYLLNKRER